MDRMEILRGYTAADTKHGMALFRGDIVTGTVIKAWTDGTLPTVADLAQIAFADYMARNA